VFDAWMRDALIKLSRKIEDLEDVKFLMSVLQNVRQYTLLLSLPLT
jgi:hypothetical protein